MFSRTKLQKYIIVFRVPGSHVTIQASIQMATDKAQSYLPAFGMTPARRMNFWWSWRPKAIYLNWDELMENGVPVQNPRLIWYSFQRLANAGWRVEGKEFAKYYWWIFN